MAYDPLRERAKQGDGRAIETLLNTALQPEQVTARVRTKEDALLVVLEASHEPDPVRCVLLLKQCMDDVQIARKYPLLVIMARKLGDSFPAWVEKISLQSSPHLVSSGQGPETFEFSAQQNRCLNQFSQQSKWVGYFMIGIGGLLIVPAILFLTSGAMNVVRGGFFALLPGLLQSFLPGTILLLEGSSQFFISRKLNLIVETEGHDIDILMEAITEVGKVNQLMIWVFVVGLIGVLIMVGLFIPVTLAM